MARVVVIGFLWLLAGGLSGTAAANERLVLTYEVWKGGFHALDLEANLARGDGDYIISFAARTSGWIGWIYPYLLEGEAGGKLTDEGPMPARFATLSRSRSDEKRRAISYLGDGSLVTWSDPSRSVEDDEESVPTPMRRNTLDPASAILSVAEAVTRAGKCQGNYPVYDGRRRFDLSISLIGSEPLAPSRYSSYSGPATLCRVVVNKLAGFRDRGGEGGLPAIINVWLASVADSEPMVPVRLEGESALGNMIIHLVGTKLEPDTRDVPMGRSAAR
jgi:hypothetical protein